HLRAFDAAETRSMHWIQHRGLRGAVAEYLERERAHVAGEIEWLDDNTARKRDPRRPSCAPATSRPEVRPRPRSEPRAAQRSAAARPPGAAGPAPRPLGAPPQCDHGARAHRKN